LIVIGQFLTHAASSILLLLIVDHALHSDAVFDTVSICVSLLESSLCYCPCWKTPTIYLPLTPRVSLPSPLRSATQFCISMDAV